MDLYSFVTPKIIEFREILKLSPKATPLDLYSIAQTASAVSWRNYLADIEDPNTKSICTFCTLKYVLIWSGATWQVIDGLDKIVSKGFQTHLSKLEHCCEGSQRLIICDKFSKDVVNVARRLATDPIDRVVCEPTVESSSACISQEISVFTAANKRLPKVRLCQTLLLQMISKMAQFVIAFVAHSIQHIWTSAYPLKCEVIVNYVLTMSVYALSC